MGDRQNDTARVDFDRQIKLEFHGSTVTVPGRRAAAEPCAECPGRKAKRSRHKKDP
jgi:hypothetical protein